MPFTGVSWWLSDKGTHLPMQEIHIRSLDGEDPLRKEMATHCSILAWQNPTNRDAWWAIVHVVAKSQTGLNNNNFPRRLSLGHRELLLRL